MNTKKALKQLQELSKYGKDLRLAATWPEEWQSLISTLLSARTKDEITIEVCKTLFKKYSTVQKLAKAKSGEVAKIIKPINFYKNKTKHIVACAKMLVKDYKNKVPHDIDELVKLPGVGRKTANVFLSELGKPAIGVDTHLAHISQQLGWTKHKTPHKIELDLQNLFPKNKWKDVNAIVVRFGRTHQRGKKRNELLNSIKRI